MSPRPRLLLVEDDASIRQFVAMALDDMAVTVVPCTTVAQALAALAEGPAALVLTDLNLGGEASGWTLLERLAADPVLAGSARRVVFSATEATTLTDRPGWPMLQVGQVLSKPVSVGALRQCVQTALAASGSDPAPAGTGGSGAAQAPVGRAAAVASHFEGDEALYEAFRAGSLTQFAQDLAAGEAACAAADGAALRHLGHSLRTVLGLLGEPAAGALAGRLQQVAEAGASREDLAAAWQALRQALQRVIQAPAP